MNKSTLTFLAIAGTSLFFSFAPVTTKLLYHFFEPIPLAFLRFLIASIIILPVFFLQKNKSLFYEIKKLWPYTIFSSLNILFFAIGIARTTVDSAVALYCGVPLLTAAISYFFLKERFSKMKLIGILTGFLGISLIIILPFFQKGIKTGDLTGNLLVLIATFSWTIYGILSKRIIEKGSSPVSIATVSFIVSLVLFLVMSPFVAKSNFITPLFNLNNLFLLLILGGIATTGSYLLMQVAIKNTSITIASLNQYLQPVFAIILAAIFLGERITGEFLFGMVLVFAGIFIATYTKK
jgi:drug/metabolite transporter (DMT)-like permease